MKVREKSKRENNNKKTKKRRRMKRRIRRKAVKQKTLSPSGNEGIRTPHDHSECYNRPRDGAPSSLALLHPGLRGLVYKPKLIFS